MISIILMIILVVYTFHYKIYKIINILTHNGHLYMDHIEKLIKKKLLSK